MLNNYIKPNNYMQPNTRNWGAISTLVFIMLFTGLYLFGFSCFCVGSGSMHPEYPVGTMVVIKKDGFEELKTGDVIAFKAEALSGGIALHRVVRITANGIYTKGDANKIEDGQLITREAYVGRAVARLPLSLNELRFFALAIILVILINMWRTI